MTDRVIEAQGLTKRFGGPHGVVALDRVSFRAEKGDVLGILGMDGAGKTTLIRILAGLLPPTEGGATIDGADTFRDRALVEELIGYAPQSPPLPGDMTLTDYLNYWGLVDGMPKARRGARIAELFGLLDLADQASQGVLDTTTYTQKRLFLAYALLHDPPILLADELMAGLAPAERAALLEKLRTIAAGRTVLIASTRLSTLKPICSHILTMTEGHATRAYETDTLLRIIGEAHHARYFLQADAPGEKVIPLVRSAKGVVDAKDTEAATVLFVDSGVFQPEEVQRILQTEGIGIRSLDEAEVIIGDIVRTLSRREAA